MVINTLAIILTDKKLEKVNGLAQAELFTKVILLTVLSSDSDMAAGFAAGASDYVTKPVILSELLQTVQSFLEKEKMSKVADSESALPPK